MSHLKVLDGLWKEIDYSKSIMNVEWLGMCFEYTAVIWLLYILQIIEDQTTSSKELWPSHASVKTGLNEL